MIVSVTNVKLLLPGYEAPPRHLQQSVRRPGAGENEHGGQTHGEHAQHQAAARRNLIAIYTHKSPVQIRENFNEVIK